MEKILLRTARSSDDQNILNELAKSEDKWIRSAVASNLNTSSSTLILLLDDENEKVRRTVLMNLQRKESRRVA